MSVAELNVDPEMQVHNIPIGEIFSDDLFNCRGHLAPIDVVDLVKSIQDIGLQTPISVMPIDHPKYKYKIIAGHRRHLACKVAKMTTVPAHIKHKMNELQARAWNLVENLKRQELNILQEAKGIEPFVKAGWREDTIATQVGMSRGWVQVRIILLKLPEPIQQEAAAGLLNQEQIRQLYTIKEDQKRFEAVKLIKDRKAKGEAAPDRLIKRKINAFAKKARTESEIFDVQAIIQEVIGNSLATVVLGWAGGAVSDYQLHVKIQETAKMLNRHYTIPLELTKSL